MASKNENPLYLMKADIEQRYNMALKQFAKEMTVLIEESYKSVIKSFYDDYDPRSYRRTFYTFYGSDRYGDADHATPIPGGYEAGIHVGAEYYPNGENPYRAQKEWVFRRTFSEGIHGFYKGEFGDWQLGRDIELKTEFIMNGKKGNLKEFLSENRKKTILYKSKHMPKRFFIKNIKAKTPQAAMDKAFKHLTTKTNMTTMFNTILDEYFGQRG